ncbi:MAG: DNA repair protein RecO [Gammaproteobacteria bacterium]|nr:DNA repair protein RecO [Gammaproteobacteria bacterium]
MRIEPNPCFVLHARPYRETSLMADVFSLPEGRITLVARGARSGRKNSRQSLLQPYQKVLLGWYGRGEMGTVSQAEASGVAYPLQGRRLISGFYLNELILRLLHRHESHVELFEAYEKALGSLSSGADEQATLRIFEKRILESVGFGLVLDHDIHTREPIRDDSIYHYRIESGPTLAAENTDQENTVPVHGLTLISLKDETLSDPVSLSEARKLMRAIITRVAGPKPLASRDLYQSYLKFR